MGLAAPLHEVSCGLSIRSLSAGNAYRQGQPFRVHHKQHDFTTGNLPKAVEWLKEQYAQHEAARHKAPAALGASVSEAAAGAQSHASGAEPPRGGMPSRVAGELEVPALPALPDTSEDTSKK